MRVVSQLLEALEEEHHGLVVGRTSQNRFTGPNLRGPQHGQAGEILTPNQRAFTGEEQLKVYTKGHSQSKRRLKQRMHCRTGSQDRSCGAHSTARQGRLLQPKGRHT